MRNHFLFAILVVIHAPSVAQLDLPAVAGNPRATISEEVGITSISISYSRPDVNKREGKIWGGVVSKGFSSFSFITNKPTAPWRAGANENTTIHFEHDVKVEGRPLKAGTYGFHVAYWPDSAILIFNKITTAWGSFYYDAKDDELRITVKPKMTDKTVEWLKYEFIQHTEKSCTIALLWENIMLPFTVSVEVDSIVINTLRNQLKGPLGFIFTNWVTAARYCLDINKNLDEAYEWSRKAIFGFGGQKNYATLYNLYQVCNRLNRTQEADSLTTELFAMGTADQLTATARTFIAQKQTDKAMQFLLANEKKHGNLFIVNTGLMRVYSAKGDFKKALEYADKAFEQATTDQQKKALEDAKAKLKEGKDIN